MFTATRLTLLSAALAAAGALVFGVAASGASASWPSCLGEPATIVGTDGNDHITGTDGDDVIVGLGGDDVLTTGDSDFGGDLVCGGDGNDALIVNGGFFATLSGDAGDDRLQASSSSLAWADYESSPEPVTVDLGAGTEHGWGNDTLVRIDLVDGSRFDDVLTGNSHMNAIYGAAGDDTIAGLGGRDDLAGGLGNDKLDGGSGRDWLDYYDAPGGVRVNLAKSTSSGGAGTDVFRGFEAVYGSKHADVFVGGPAPDTLEGNSGNDSLSGNGAHDMLIGDAGNDRLFGGAGPDTLDGGRGVDRADGGPARDVCKAERKIHCP